VQRDLHFILENAVEMAWHPKSLVLQGFMGNSLNCGAVERKSPKALWHNSFQRIYQVN